jgi:hypothetical protein
MQESVSLVVTRDAALKLELLSLPLAVSSNRG